MLHSFGIGILGTRNVNVFVPSIFNAHSNVNITGSLNSEPKRTHQKAHIGEKINNMQFRVNSHGRFSDARIGVRKTSV